ncbi:MAG: response regulator [Deltaproteobacteria bacterium]|nr:response regulator [Deltaproteobacteria bacterium]
MAEELYSQNLLIVDDEPRILHSIRRELGCERYHILSAHDGPSALQQIRDHDVGVILSDISMPGMDGISLLDTVRQEKPDVARLVLTGYGTFEHAERAINQAQVMGFLTKPWSAERLRETIRNAFEYHKTERLQGIIRDHHTHLVRSNQDLQESIREQSTRSEVIFRESIRTLARMIELHESLGEKRVDGIHSLTLRFCLKAGLEYAEADGIALSTTVRDIGNLLIPDEILNKNHRTAREKKIIEGHTILGHRILAADPVFLMARTIALGHHECWNGSGYPFGRSGDEIPLAARIAAVVDTHNHLEQNMRLRPQDIVKCMKEMSSKKLDPELLNAFITVKANSADNLSLHL